MQRTAIPFGGNGLMAGTGLFDTQPAALADVRNVSLRPGRTSVRPGLINVGNFGGANTAILGIHPLRAAGVTAVVTYAASTRVVQLWMVSPDFTRRLVQTLWTLAVAAPFPKVSMTDVWDRLIIAHDEPLYSVREPTQVYQRLPTETVGDLTAQLAIVGGSLSAIRFRGVTRHLSYLVGWGYGTEVLAERNRPEIVRISLPDDPTVFVPEHYFIAGQRNDPVLGCWPAGDVLQALKSTESYTIIGSDRPSFGILPADMLFGVASSRLAVTVGDTLYRWAFDGPRVSTGGRSEDKALPLDLDNLGLTDPPVLDYSNAFACYDPLERVVMFCFPAQLLAYVFHVELQQWSVRDYFTLQCAGIFVRDASASQSGPTAVPAFTSSSFGAATLGAATSPGTVNVGVTGSLIGGELIEVWGRPRVVGVSSWSLIGTLTAAIGANAVSCTYTAFGVTWDLATRLTVTGVASSAYTATDRFAWPLGCQGTGQVPIPVIASRFQSSIASFFETRPAVEPDKGALLFLLSCPGTAQTELAYELRQRVPLGAYSAESAVPLLATASLGVAVRFGIDAIRNTQRDIQVRVKSAELTGAWTDITLDNYMGPARYSTAASNRLTSPSRIRYVLTAPVEPAYAFDTAQAGIELGSPFVDETGNFAFTPVANFPPGFASVVYTSAYEDRTVTSSTPSRVRRVINWQSIEYVSLWSSTFVPT